jgi:hypothetical protein
LVLLDHRAVRALSAQLDPPGLKDHWGHRASLDPLGLQDRRVTWDREEPIRGPQGRLDLQGRKGQLVSLDLWGQVGLAVSLGRADPPDQPVHPVSSACPGPRDHLEHRAPLGQLAQVAQ